MQIDYVIFGQVALFWGFYKRTIGKYVLVIHDLNSPSKGLQRGDITHQHLYQQLSANPAMQPRHRELLFTILKTQQGGGGGGGGMGPSPRVLSPVPPPPQAAAAAHPLFQQQQQLRVSPLPPNGESCTCFTRLKRTLTCLCCLVFRAALWLYSFLVFAVDVGCFFDLRGFCVYCVFHFFIQG